MISPAALRPNQGPQPISIVCKVSEANGARPFKLSDNPRKATGDPAEVSRYLKFFGSEDSWSNPYGCDGGRSRRPAASNPSII